jgi:serine/threonine protein kinase
MARYELVERIGVGGMAEIYRGKAIAGGGFEKPVAIKKILPHLSQDKRFVELLITEAKTLSSLRHRNIVQIYDLGLGEDGQYFLVMEYVDGTDLGALYESLEKRKRRLSLGVALHVCGEVCEALDHAHRARGPGGDPLGLVHRDVSPSNVLLSRSGEVKLTDFGIAKRTEEVTGHGGVRGKFAYISPEQAHNTHVDGRSDVYSVGIMLYELVTGTRLFSDLPDFDALRAVREGRTRRPRDVDPAIDPELDRIVMTALAARPEDRFPSAGNFGAQLRSLRYALLSTAADPAVEMSRMVDEMGARPAPGIVARAPTFVRISTVAGFAGFELSEESSSGFTNEQTQDHHGEEEETHAVRLASTGARPSDRLDSELALDEGDTRVATDPGERARAMARISTAHDRSSSARDRSSTDRDRSSSDRDRSSTDRERPSSDVGPPTGEFDLSDAETSVLDYRRAQLAVPRPGRGGGGTFRPFAAGDAHPGAEHPGGVVSLRPPASGMKSSGASVSPATLAAASAPTLSLKIGSVPSAVPDSHREDAAPTIRRWFRLGGQAPTAEGSRPGPGGQPAPRPRTIAFRRRAILIGAGAAVTVAIVAFLFTGVLLGGSDTAAPPDAAPPPPDAAATMTMPPEKVEPKPVRKKKKKKPAAKKKTTKTTKGSKSEKSTKGDKR